MPAWPDAPASRRSASRRAAQSALPRFCSKQYAPVCGERDGQRREFGNACEARAEDFAVVHDGGC